MKEVTVKSTQGQYICKNASAQFGPPSKAKLLGGREGGPLRGEQSKCDATQKKADEKQNSIEGTERERVSEAIPLLLLLHCNKQIGNEGTRSNRHPKESTASQPTKEALSGGRGRARMSRRCERVCGRHGLVPVVTLILCNV